MKQEQAEAVALAALRWLVAEPERAGQFLAATGAGPETLRACLGDPHFLGGVLDFLLASESLVTQFCEAEDLACDLPRRARAALPGGDTPHWT
ncbi:MAG TPA: DUF3572 domain-containing protein [Paracoccaceae bacterium]|nr:DUF3572 domain-containing protein [Paracoccaceae bacterium]